MEEYCVHMIDKNAVIEETAGKRSFRLKFECEIKEYERKMLSSCDCPYILPMHFIREEGDLNAYYDFTGCIQLKEYIERNKSGTFSDSSKNQAVCTALAVMAGVLECIKELEGYLIFTERISTHTDVIFINAETGKVMLAFYPNQSGGIPLQKRIISLMEDMGGLYGDKETEMCFDRLIDLIRVKNPGLRGMITMLGTARREQRYIDWSSKDFRSMEEKREIQETLNVIFNSNDGEGKHAPPVENSRALCQKRKSFLFVSIQVALAAGLAALIFSGAANLTQIIGIGIIAASGDVWLIRKVQTI
jgi:hypothetical protein